jgi:hypothetical protein
VRLSGLPAEKVGADEELVTGEEDEQTVWSADGTLFEFGSNGWKERGRGQARVKAATNGESSAWATMSADNLQVLIDKGNRMLSAFTGACAASPICCHRHLKLRVDVLIQCGVWIQVDTLYSWKDALLV